MDNLDLKIIYLLKENSRITIKNISKKINLTAPAVKSRMDKLIKNKLIESFTIKVSSTLEKRKFISFITLFMKTTSHEQLQHFLKNNIGVLEAYRISGNGCYLIKFIYKNDNDLITFLDQISLYGTHQINTSIAQIK
ncbi:Lrp/AsnC family transcriptional regulator [Pectinatus sottacetonis]|uniref:Lrp/AsnC family transcriptional regulator n=1 Tax=Pectinatus sottacetonis TaxID=1002795 RepID=UPI0018C5C49C|nr:Lrp/AsnC family transcriptional regulator [Pectinatus sottacetonis]